MAWYDWIGPAGAMAGFAGGELGGQVASSIDAPRRWAWENIGQALGGSGTTSGSQLLQELFGADPESFGTQLGGGVLEAALDPVNLLSAGLLGKAGGILGGAGRNLAMRSAAKPLIMEELAAVNKLGSAAKGFMGTASAAEDAALRAAGQPGRMLENLNVPSHLGATYSQDVLRELPEVTELGARGMMPTYKRMSPEVSEAVDRLGIGYPTEGGTFAYQRPTFARGSGGVMHPFGDIPSGSPLETLGGGSIRTPGLEEMISGSRFQPPPQVTGSMPMPTMGELAGRPKGIEQLDMFKSMPGAMVDTPAGYSHLLDMPADQGFGAAGQRSKELRRALMELTSNESLSPLERWLSTTRFGQF